MLTNLLQCHRKDAFALTGMVHPSLAFLLEKACREKASSLLDPFHLQLSSVESVKLNALALLRSTGAIYLAKFVKTMLNQRSTKRT